MGRKKMTDLMKVNVRLSSDYKILIPEFALNISGYIRKLIEKDITDRNLRKVK